MFQFAALAVAFIILFLMLTKRKDFGTSICVAAVLLGVLTAGSIGSFFELSLDALLKKSSIETMVAVLFVGVLSGICRHYGILDAIVVNLKIVIRNPRIILMLVPAIIGLMPVVGGAIISVPFVDNIAEEYGVSQERKGAINLVFRHAGMLMMPFSTTVIVALDILNGVSYIELASRMIFFVAGNMLMGYIFFVRDIPNRQAVQPEGDHRRALVELIKNLSPILSVVVMTMLFNTPIYIGVGIGILIAFLISNKENFGQVLLKATNPKLMLTIAGINLMKGFIQNLDVVIDILTTSFGSGAGMLVAYALTAFFFAFITGTSLTPLGIILPLLLAIPQSHHMLLANTFLIFTSSYLGYFFSPLHLCQVVTIDYLKTSTGQLMREYRFYAFGIFLVAMVGYTLFAFII